MPESDLSIQIQSRDIDVLQSLFESRVMTSLHIAALHFGGKEPAAKKRIQKLKAAKLITDRKRQVNEPSVLFLARKAFAILEAKGILEKYPALGLASFEKRTQVADATIRHELEVLDVKTAICSAIKKAPNLAIDEFTTWPALNAFEATIQSERLQRIVKPDGFIQISQDDGEGKWGHSLFLELDRSSETQEILALKAACYAEHYRSGGFALRNGGTRTEFDKFPFRVLFVLKTAERRNNTAEKSLANQSSDPHPGTSFHT